MLKTPILMILVFWSCFYPGLSDHAGHGHHDHHGNHHDHHDHKSGHEHDHHDHGHHGHEEHGDHDEHHGHDSSEDPGSSGKLRLPNVKDCENRIHHAKFGKHGYFFSWENDVTKNLTVTWFTGRNICRRHCMDLVSLETSEENEFIQGRMIQGLTRFIWTSGRKCNFKGCEDRVDLQPAIVKGWFWSGSGVRLGVNPTGDRVEGDWGETGGAGDPQPDNRELKLTGFNDEACLAVLNNYYGDGVVWHDIACYHKKSFVCEDSDELLEYVRQSHPDAKL